MITGATRPQFRTATVDCMLQTTPVQQNELQEYQENQAFDPRQYLAILRKRKFYLLVPLILVLTLGVSAALLWPPTYLSEGKILSNPNRFRLISFGRPSLQQQGNGFRS